MSPLVPSNLITAVTEKKKKKPTMSVGEETRQTEIKLLS